LKAECVNGKAAFGPLFLIIRNPMLVSILNAMRVTAQAHSGSSSVRLNSSKLAAGTVTAQERVCAKRQ
jgi:hypothetical protein